MLGRLQVVILKVCCSEEWWYSANSVKVRVIPKVRWPDVPKMWKVSFSEGSSKTAVKRGLLIL